MSSFLDKLNLRPGEKRLVYIISLVVFLLFNYFFVWPRFGEWGRTEQRILDAKTSLQKFQAEISKRAAYEKELARLKERGVQVLEEDRALLMNSTVFSQATLSGVFFSGSAPAPKSSGKTNSFYDEQGLVLSGISAEEKNLVDFLYQLGNGNSLIRAKNMTLSPDPARQRLNGNLTLIASFQRKTPAKPAAAPARTTNAPPKTVAATPPAAKTNSPFRSATPIRPTNTTARVTNATTRITNALGQVVNSPGAPRK